MSRFPMTRFLPLTALLALGLVTPAAHAQGIFGRIKKKAAEKVNERIDQRTDAELDALINGSEQVITCTVNDQKCISKVHAAGKKVQYVDADGKPVAKQPDLQPQSASPAGGAPGQDAESTPPGSGAWLNYDFVPGDKVIFYDDFADDHVGDLPTHEDIEDGNFTVVDVGGHKYLRTVTGGNFWINLPDTLPDRFTIEAKFFEAPDEGNALDFTVGADGDHTVEVWCYHSSAGVSGEGVNGGKNSTQDESGIADNAFVNCRFMFDKGYVKAYLNAQRLGQLNGLLISHTQKIHVKLPGASDDAHATLVTDIRVAAGGKPLYDQLNASGRVSTHGILFASGSDKIQGESTPTLKEIGDMLTQHADLKLLIEGHTDNVGDATSNQGLSERRAAAVKTYLVNTYHVDPNRLTTKGYGDTKPIDTNDTSEGRQNNRRVELVKQ